MCGFKTNNIQPTVKTCVKQPLSKTPKICFQDQLSLNAGLKYCRMLQGEHSAIRSTFIKLPFVFVLSIFRVAVLHMFYCIKCTVPYLRNYSFCKKCESRFAGFIRSQLIRTHTAITPQKGTGFLQSVFLSQEPL